MTAGVDLGREPISCNAMSSENTGWLIIGCREASFAESNSGPLKHSSVCCSDCAKEGRSSLLQCALTS